MTFRRLENNQIVLIPLGKCWTCLYSASYRHSSVIRLSSCDLEPYIYADDLYIIGESGNSGYTATEQII
jgi:hypothetical protein